MSDLTTRLRILATTDLHMNLRGFDYAADVQGDDHGLSSLATLIAQARTDNAPGPCVLFDNGDFLQGTPLADTLATDGTDAAHPLVAAFNTLGFDAVGLGNHDLDYGVPLLERVIDGLCAAVICTNVKHSGISGLLPSVMITRQVQTPDGLRPLRIGVMSALPLETAQWNRNALPKGTSISDPVATLDTNATRLRAQGADVIVVLAHMGLGHAGAPTHSGDAGAVQVAKLRSIDAVVAGHTHRRFPAHDGWTMPPDVTLPVVMPGASGAELGVIDLDLLWNGTRWQITQHHVHRLTQTPETPPDKKLSALSAPSHRRVRTALAETVAHIPDTLHSYFAMVQPAQTMALSARAKAMVIQRALEHTGLSDLPLLATATARAVGGPDGVRNFAHIAPGPVLRRQLVPFSAFANDLCALVLSSDKLHAWLERSAEVYSRLDARKTQSLLDENCPTFVFDSIYGLTYRIDLSRPAGSRIHDMRHQGQPLSPTDRFVLATNSFRANGGGGYDKFGLPAPALTADVPMIDAQILALNADDLQHWAETPPWTLEAGGARAWFDTSPDAAAHLSELSRFCPDITGRTADGFDRIEITV